MEIICKILSYLPWWEMVRHLSETCCAMNNAYKENWKNIVDMLRNIGMLKRLNCGKLSTELSFNAYNPDITKPLLGNTVLTSLQYAAPFTVIHDHSHRFHTDCS